MNKGRGTFRFSGVFTFFFLAFGLAPSWSQAGEDRTGQLAFTPEQVKALREAAAGSTLVPVGDILLDLSQINAKGHFTSILWNAGQVNYYFDPGSVIAEWEKEVFRQAVDQWTGTAAVTITENPAARPVIRVTKNVSQEGCYSAVGVCASCDGIQDLNLGQKPNSVGCWNLGTITHELGHALGLHHEQSRSDRDAFVRLTIEEGAGVSACAGILRTNWGILQTALPSTSYDFASVMHYPQSGGFKCDKDNNLLVSMQAIAIQPPGEPAGSESACTSLNQCTSLMGQRAAPSDRDLFGLAQVYGTRYYVVSEGDGEGQFVVSGFPVTCGDNCYTAPVGTPISISAVPAQGSVFLRFAGACAGKTCEFNTAANGIVRGRFVKVSTLALAGLFAPVVDSRIFDSGFENQ